MAKIKPKKKPYINLRVAILEAGYNQAKIAEMLGMACSTFNQKLNGHIEFSITESCKIAKLLNKSLDYLFFEEHVAKRQ
jgi:transcriptional regulator with XRE-family HTH domain